MCVYERERAGGKREVGVREEEHVLAPPCVHRTLEEPKEGGRAELHVLLAKWECAF